MTEYTLKPTLYRGEGWQNLEKLAVSKNILTAAPRSQLSFGAAVFQQLAVSKFVNHNLTKTAVTVLISTEGGLLELRSG